MHSCVPGQRVLLGASGAVSRPVACVCSRDGVCSFAYLFARLFVCVSCSLFRRSFFPISLFLIIYIHNNNDNAARIAIRGAVCGGVARVSNLAAVVCAAAIATETTWLCNY